MVWRERGGEAWEEEEESAMEVEVAESRTTGVEDKKRE